MIQRIGMVILIVAIVLGGGFYAYRQLVPPPVEETKGPVYSTQPVTRGDISVGVDTIGSLNPSHGGGLHIPGGYDYNPGQATSYMVDQVLAKDGDEVKQGQVLIRLKAPDLATQYENVLAKLHSDRKALASLMNVPVEKVDEIDPDAGITLRAPINGRVVSVEAQEGKKLEQGSIVARVVDDSRFQLVAKLTPGEFSLITQETPAVLRFTQFSELVEAKIIDINPNPVPESGAELTSDQAPEIKDDNYIFVYWVTLEGKNSGLIRPGMPVSVGFITNKADAKKPIDPMNVKWIRFSSQVEKYVNEERVLSRAEGIVTQIHVKQMGLVKAGDPIVTMAGQDVRELVRQKLEEIRKHKMDLQQFQVKQGMLEVRAPMDGVVADIQAQPGMTVQPGHWLGSVYKTSNMMMWVQIDDIDILYVKQGAPVQVTVDALPGKSFKGEVERVATMGKDMNGIARFEVIIRVTGSPELRPGMQAKARINAESRTDVLLVPVEAIFGEDGQNKVEILTSDGFPKAITVELGLMNDRVAEVISGLEEGQLVITGSSSDLLPSQKIQSDKFLPTGPKGDDNNSGKNGDTTGPKGEPAMPKQ